MTPEAALAELRAAGDPDKASEMARYHKVARPHLGVTNPVIDVAVKDWRKSLTLDARITLADGLWRTNIHEARVAAAKLFTQARMRPDDLVWETIKAGCRILTLEPSQITRLSPDKNASPPIPNDWMT